MKVPFFNYPFVYSQYESEIDKKINKVIKKGEFILQNDLLNFENNLKKFLNAKFAFGVSDGTNAIILCLKAAGMKSGDEAIMSSHTYIATASAVHDAGGIPVLVNCKDDFLIDEREIEKAITKKTKFIIPTQLNGRVCQMNIILKIAKKYNLIVIEDGAQAIGAKFKKKFSTTFGLAGTISFYPAKILGCFGDGGAVITNNKGFAKKISMMRDHGRSKDGKVVSWGTNSRLDNLQAAILNIKLKHLKKDIAKRRKIASLYYKLLKNNKYLHLPPPPNNNSNNFDVYQNFEILADKRDALRQYLRKNSIGTIIQWNGQALHMIKNLKMKYKNLQKTNNIFKKILLLPMNCSLSTKDVIFVSKMINKFYEKN